MKSIRPHFVGMDRNHFIVRDFLRDVCGGFRAEQCGKDVVYLANFRGVVVAAIDTRRFGGFWLDWLIFCSGNAVLVEIKTPEAYAAKNHSLKPGETWTLENMPIDTAIISTDEQVEKLFAGLIARL